MLSAKISASQTKSPPATEKPDDARMVIDEILGAQGKPDASELMCLALAAGMRQLPQSAAFELSIKYLSILNQVEAINALW